MKTNIKLSVLSLLLILGVNVWAQPGYGGEWKKTRLYGHTYAPNGFTEEQYDFIRDHNEIFCFEKTHLRGVYGNPSHEESSKDDAAYLKSLNPRCKPITIYSIETAYYQYNESTAEALAEHPEWATTTDSVRYKWDLHNADRNDWYVNTMNDLVNNSELEGIFIDGVEGVYSTYAPEIKSIMGRMDGLSLMNGFNPKSTTKFKTGPEFLEHCAGVFVDSWFRRELDTKEGAQTMLDTCIAIPEDKYMILFSANDNDGIWGTDHTFSHAAYLIVANAYTYYRWAGDGLWGPDVLTLYHEDFDKEMGDPLGKAKKVGYVYTRVFEHCTVTLDLENVTSSIVWNQNNVAVPEPDYINVALDGTATQSTTAYDGDASFAIDGNTNGTYNDGSVSHTDVEVQGTWWMVTLDKSYTIGHVTVYNRTDGYMNRLSNFTIEVLNDIDEVVFTQTLTTYPNPSITINTGDVIGNRVRILQNSASTALALAEVEVYGYTPDLVTEISMEDQKRFIIYPNPVQDILSVELGNVESAAYQVLNTAGQIVSSGNIFTSSSTIDISGLTSGIYTVKILSASKTQVKKIIKK